ncbi:MAG: ankyrin repeat domain-containing protein [Deltaproteobacteria bacterium]
MNKIIGSVSKAITDAVLRFRKEGKREAGDIRSPLVAAVRSGNSTEVARLLAGPGARLTLRDKDGRTVLHSLVPELVKLADSEKAPAYACMDLLLAGGADINAVDHYGNTPLIDAVKLGDAMTVGFLLKNGANVNCRDNKGKTALHAFFMVSGPIYIRHINREVNLTQIEAQIAEMLVRNGGDVNAADEQGLTPLADAVKLGDAKTVELLLNNGADANTRDNDGRTPLHLVNAIVADRSTPGQITRITEMLIHSGADVNARDNQQRTPLFYSRLDCMCVMIDCGADVNARDEEGKTPLFCVKSQKCLETLIEKGADIEAADREGRKYRQ